MAEFKLDEDERKKLEEWDKKHLEEAHGGQEPYAGAIGGRTVFQVSYTSMGQIVTVYCALCAPYGKEENKDKYKTCLTDFSNW